MAPNPTPFQPGQAANVRKAVLTRDMLRIEKQVEKYHGELRDAQAGAYTRSHFSSTGALPSTL